MPQNDSCKKVNETVTEHEEIKTAALVGGLGYLWSTFIAP